MISRILDYFRRDKPNAAVEMRVNARQTLTLVESVERRRSELGSEFPFAGQLDRGKYNVRSNKQPIR